MNIYSDQELFSEIREWCKQNPLNILELGITPYAKELHPLYGTKHTEETRKLMSESHSGEKNHMYGIRGKDNPNYGRKRNDLVAINKSRAGRIVSESTKEKLREQRIGKSNPMHGQKHTEESKKKMARYGKDNPSYGRKVSEETKQKLRDAAAKRKAKFYHPD
jgi:hypothetical protein